MPARTYKTLLKNPKERNHREHRSKKGRRPHKIQSGRVLTYKEKKRRLKNKETLHQIQRYV